MRQQFAVFIDQTSLRCPHTAANMNGIGRRTHNTTIGHNGADVIDLQLNGSIGRVFRELCLDCAPQSTVQECRSVPTMSYAQRIIVRFGHTSFENCQTIANFNELAPKSINTTWGAGCRRIR